MPFLILLPGVASVLLSTRLQLSNHGAFHIGYINQILLGNSTPENVVLPGFEANVYWLYHALLAVVVTILNVPAPIASITINFIALAGSFYWINKFLKLLGIDKRNPIAIGFYIIFIIFGLNLFGSVHTLNNLLHQESILTSLSELSGPVRIVFNADHRLSNLFHKFLNFNGFPTGILYYSFALYSSSLLLREKLKSKNILLLMLAISGALFFHTTTGIFMLATITPSILISLIYCNKENLKAQIQHVKVFDLILIFLIALILFIPALHYVMEAARAFSAKADLGGPYIYNLKSVLSSIYPLIPFSILAVFLGIRKKSVLTFFLSILCLFGYILSIIVNLPGGNQYKFIYLSTIPLCILNIIGLDYVLNKLEGKLRLGGKIVFSAGLILLSLNILLVANSHLRSNWFSDNSYYYEGKLILLKPGSKYKEIYEWIREYSPTNSVVIQPLQSKDNSNVYTIAQRLPYVAEGVFYAAGIQEYYNRVDNVELFYAIDTPKSKRLEILDKFRDFGSDYSVILFVPENITKIFDLNNNSLNMIYSDKEGNLYTFKK
ncbi:MAG: hypothetical protein O6940_08085 [Ignavibacteria bacterium]|nr:hypothetical protein [Ignavibacteria bacterium]